MARTSMRARHPIRPEMIWLLKVVGFRYSHTRDAYVLRGVGKRHGPVFVVQRGVKQAVPH